MKKVVISLLALASILVSARDIYVDYVGGRSTNPGTEEKPFNRLPQALKIVKPGDVIKIKPAGKPISDIILVQNITGEAGKPIVIDCMNNIFTGEKALVASEWQEVSPGLFKRVKNDFPHNAARYFMIHKGQSVRMGRFTKSRACAAFKAVNDLQPGEWTIVDPEPKSKARHDIEFYVKLAEGEKSLSDGQWAEAGRFCGVAISSLCAPETCDGRKGQNGDCPKQHCNYITIRNVVVTHYLNDGFNIHGNCKGIRFENVAAIECGDDGFSAHNKTEVALENFVSLRNSTAICHINEAKTTHRNIYCEGTLGIDFYPCDATDTTLTDAWILGDSCDGIKISNNKGGSCVVKNAYCLNRNAKAVFTRNKNNKIPSTVSFKNVHILGYGYPTQFNGITVEDSQAAMLETFAAKRKELFALFGGAVK